MIIIKQLYARLRLFFILTSFLFTSKHKIRCKIFDSLHLRNFFIDDGWNNILQVPRKNEPISTSQNKDFNTAILFPGRLRNWELSKDLVYSLAENSHVFLMVDKTDLNIIKEIKHKKIHARIIEQTEYKNAYRNMPNIVFSQYLKLKASIKEIYKFEKEKKYFFKYFIKLRTDYCYLNSNILLNMNREKNEDCLFAQSDLNFSGRREFFLPIQNFFEFAHWVYYNDFNNLKYLPVNPHQIVNSDFGATRYNWLAYPKKIIGNTKNRRPPGELIKKMFKKNFNLALKYKFKANDAIKKIGGQDYFASEQSFSYFLNLCGIICKTHNKFIGHIIPNDKLNPDGLKPGVLDYRNDMANLNVQNYSKLKK